MVALTSYRTTSRGGWNHLNSVKEAHPHRITIPGWRAHLKYLKGIKITQSLESPWRRLDCVCWKGRIRKGDNDYRLSVAFKTADKLEEFMKDWHLDYVDSTGGIDLSQELGS